MYIMEVKFLHNNCLHATVSLGLFRFDESSDDEESRQERTSISQLRCIICFSDNTSDLVTNPTNEGFETLCKASAVLKDHVYLTLKPFLGEPFNKQLSFSWHRHCHRMFAHEGERKIRITDDRLSDFESHQCLNPSTSITTPEMSGFTKSKTTRATLPVWNKSLCIICQKRKYKGDVKVNTCLTLPSSNKLKDASIFQNDEASVRILSCIDVVAGDGVYHKACYAAYIIDHERGKKKK